MQRLRAASDKVFRSYIEGDDEAHHGGHPQGGGRGRAHGEHKGDGNPTQRSSVKFDHFDFPSGKAALDVEMPRGKRTIPISDLGNTSTRVFNTDMTR